MLFNYRIRLVYGTAYIYLTLLLVMETQEFKGRRLGTHASNLLIIYCINIICFFHQFRIGFVQQIGRVEEFVVVAHWHGNFVVANIILLIIFPLRFYNLKLEVRSVITSLVDEIDRGIVHIEFRLTESVIWHERTLA